MKAAVDWRVKDGFEPTRSFDVDEMVIYGNHHNTKVTEVLGDGLYKIHCYGTRTKYGNEVNYSEFQETNWFSLFKIDGVKETKLTKPESFTMSKNSFMLSSVISKVLSDYAGVDFTPEYQRDWVWTLEDKQKLIGSIFNNITIGMIVLASKPYADNQKSLEVIDGKQRLTALVEFFEDRFQYEGYYFSQLSQTDKNHFEDYSIMVGTLERPSEKEKYAAFLAVNTFGKVMDEEHLKSVREKYLSL
jgi:hypothetical protein